MKTPVERTPEQMAENFALLVGELRTWLDTRDINGETIGDIRRQCFMPYPSIWNGIVRDETAAREKSTPHGLHEGDEVTFNRINVTVPGEPGETRMVKGTVVGFLRTGAVVNWSENGRACQSIMNPALLIKVPNANPTQSQNEVSPGGGA